jgi:NDP-sugar pyrophosphorylase family protein
MVMVAGKPFLAYQLEFLKKKGISEVVLCVGHLGEQIEDHFGDGRKYGLHISYSYEREQLLGTGGAIKNAERLLHGEFFTMYGDSYLTLDFSAVMSYFKKSGRPALMTIFKNNGRYDKSNIAIEGNFITQYGNKGPEQELVYIDYGASLFNKQVLELIPANTPSAMGEMFQQLIEKQQLLAYEVSQRFYQIGSPEGLKEFTELIEGKMKR